MTANLNSTHNLGNKIKYFRPDWINIIPHFLVTEFFAIFIWFLCSAPFLIVMDNQPKSVQELCWLLLFLAISAVTIWVGITSIVRVSLYQHGLVYKCAWWTKVIRHENIKDISYKITSYQRYGQTIGNAYVYKIGVKNTRKIVLDGRISKVAELGQSIEQEIVNRYLNEVLSKFQAGEVLNFGVWKVSINGIKVGSKSIPWGDFDKVEIDNGIVSICKTGNNWFSWHKTPIHEVPNLAIFLEIINRKITENNNLTSSIQSKSRST
jgi:hypothetical protein